MTTTKPIIQVCITLKRKKQDGFKQDKLFNIILFTNGQVEDCIETSVPIEVLKNLFDDQLSNKFEPTELYFFEPVPEPKS